MTIPGFVYCDDNACAMRGTQHRPGNCIMEPRGEFSIGGDLWCGLSKLIEEAGELNDLLPELLLLRSLGRVQQVAGKIIGNEGKDNHWDGSNLRQRLIEEFGDLGAALRFVAERNGLDNAALQQRLDHKLALFHQWDVETKAARAERKAA